MVNLEKSNGLQVDTSIFDSFNKLTSVDEKVRLKGASGLIKTLEETSDEKVNIRKNVLQTGLKYSFDSDSKAAGLCDQAIGAW